MLVRALPFIYRVCFPTYLLLPSACSSMEIKRRTQSVVCLPYALTPIQLFNEEARRIQDPGSRSYCCTRHILFEPGTLYQVRTSVALNPFSTAVPIWGQTILIPSGSSPKRDWGPKIIVVILAVIFKAASANQGNCSRLEYRQVASRHTVKVLTSLQHAAKFASSLET